MDSGLLHDLWQTSTRAAAADAAVPGMIELDELELLAFEGPDAAAFLQGYLTCDTARLAPGRWQACALCNLKGRVVASGFVRRDAAHRITWLLHRSLVEVVTAFLARYLAFSKTRVTVPTGERLVLGLVGEPMPEPLRIAVTPEQETRPSMGIAVIETPAALADTAQGRARISREDWATESIRHRLVWLDATLSGRFLPQMLDLVELGAVDFDKGCYLGQEVVARAEHRGQVKRGLSLLHWSGARAPAVGADVEDAAGHVVGTLVAATDAVDGERLCLAVLKAGTQGPWREQDVRLEARI